MRSHGCVSSLLICFQPLPLIATRISQDHNIFSALVAAGEEGASAAAIADQTKLKPAALSAILEYLSSQNMAKETRPGNYTATKLSELLLAPLFVDGTTHL